MVPHSLPVGRELRPVRCDDQQGISRYHADELSEGFLGSLIGPMPILQKEHYRFSLGARRKNRGKRFEHRESQVFTFQVLRDGVPVALYGQQIEVERNVMLERRVDVADGRNRIFLQSMRILYL